jgi:hypothetical protein
MAILRSSDYNGSYDNGTSSWTNGTSGWVVAGDGHAEFSSASIRGGLKAGSVYINADNRWRRNSSDTSSSSEFKVGSSDKYLYFDGTDLTFTGNLSAAGGTFTGTLSVGSVRVGNEAINSGSPEKGISISGAGLTQWDNAWIQRSDNSVYFRAGNTTTYIQLDTFGNNEIEFPNFSVNSQGSIVATDADITGTITATSGTFAGNLSAAGGTFIGALSGGTIDIGGSDATSFHVDSAGNLWLGATTYAAAPFKVSSTGSLTANSGTFSGNLSSAGGTFTGTLSVGSVRVGNEAINSGSPEKGISISGAGLTQWDNAWIQRSDNSVYFKAGNTTRYIQLDTSGNNEIEFPNFSVNNDGSIVATNADITGRITATSGTISGDLVTGGTIKGTSIDIGNGTFIVTSDGEITATAGKLGPYSITSQGISEESGIRSVKIHPVVGTSSEPVLSVAFGDFTSKVSAGGFSLESGGGASSSLGAGGVSTSGTVVASSFIGTDDKFLGKEISSSRIF